MNWAAIAAVISSLTLLATLLVAPYVYGKLTQQTADNNKRLDGHDARFIRQELVLDEHREILSVHGSGIEGLKQWRDGYNAATKRVEGSK